MIRQKNNGFVLLLTLVMIAIAGLILARLANHRLTLVLAANDKIESLQKRWGSLTIRRCSAYNSANAVLEGDYSIPMGDLIFHTRIDSESRKLNLNAVARMAGRDGLQLIATDLMYGGRTELAPTFAGRFRFDSWGEVFDLDLLPCGMASAELLVEKSRNITCWGDGRLHYLYTPDHVIAALEPMVGFQDTKKFLDTRRLRPELSFEDMMDELRSNSVEPLRLETWLSDREDTRSIWMLIETKNHGRYLGSEFTVAHRTTNGSTELTTFQW